jgi:hypothetical protein
LTAARADRARAQAALAAFFAPTTDPATLVAAVPPAGIPRHVLPTVEELVAHAESQLPELSALKHEQESAALAGSAAGRRPIPEPEVVSARSRQGRAAMGRCGNGLQHPHRHSALRSETQQAPAQARRAQAEARIASFQAVLHQARRAAHVVIERRQAADSYRASTATSAAARTHRCGQLRRWGRSILGWSTPIGKRFNETAAGRADAAASRRNRLELVSGWRSDEAYAPVAIIVSVLLATACRGASGAGRGASPQERTLDVTSWTQQELFMEHPPSSPGKRFPPSI